MRVAAAPGPRVGGRLAARLQPVRDAGGGGVPAGQGLLALAARLAPLLLPASGKRYNTRSSISLNLFLCQHETVN